MKGDKTRSQFEQELRRKNLPEPELAGKALRLMEALLEQEMDEAIYPSHNELAQKGQTVKYRKTDALKQPH